MSQSSRNSDKRPAPNDFYRGDDKNKPERSLFNPQSDNPIAFNKLATDDVGENGRRHFPQRRQRQEVVTRSLDKDKASRKQSTQPARPTRGILWDPNSATATATRTTTVTPTSISPSSQNRQLKQSKDERVAATLQSGPVKTPSKLKTTTAATTIASPTSAAASNKNVAVDEHRAQLKVLLHRIQKMEAKINQLSASTRRNSYVYGFHQDVGRKKDTRNENADVEDDDALTYSRHRQRQRDMDIVDDGDDDDDEDENSSLFSRGQPSSRRPISTTEGITTASPAVNVTLHPWLTMKLDTQLWQSVDQFWKEKTKLHLQLASAYFDIIQYDYEFAEKKNLLTLCWKHAVYSMVEQFRQAFHRHQTLSTWVNHIKPPGDDDHYSNEKRKQTVKLETTDNNGENELLSDDLASLSVDSNEIMIPVVSENGMTMMALMDSDDENDEDNNETNKLALQMILDRHLQVLQTWLDTFISSADGLYQQMMKVLQSMDDSNDLTTMEAHLHAWRRTRRWKWFRLIPFRGDLARYRFVYGQKTTNYELAWLWYTLGVWVIPATGRFYFHQSLLLNAPHYSPLYEFHKLYFGIRSLTVRRNAFVNAREGLITLFENNRQWQARILDQNKRSNSGFMTGKQRQQRQRRKQQHIKEEAVIMPEQMVTGMFIRLHGALFTKIDLESFAHTKRRYFEALFPTKGQQVTIKGTSTTASATATTTFSCSQLSGRQYFWLESILLNLSALYHYEYESSALTKALSLSKKEWTTIDETSRQQHHQERNALLDQLNDSILFSYAVDLLCQVAVELVSRFLEDSITLSAPSLPVFPRVVFSIQANASLLFGAEAESASVVEQIQQSQQENTEQGGDEMAWLIYIEVLVHWMVVTGIGIQSTIDGKSVWEKVISNVMRPSAYGHHRDDDDDNDKITSSFWPIMVNFFTKLLHGLPESTRYQVINRHLLDSDNPWTADVDSQLTNTTWHDLVMQWLGSRPILPEEEYLRGVGWMDDFLLSTTTAGEAIPADGNGDDTTNVTAPDSMTMDMRRRLRILDYGFILVKQMHSVLEYDPVHELFLVKSASEDLMASETEMLPILTAMDDAVLFDTTVPLEEEENYDNDQGKEHMTESMGFKHDVHNYMAEVEDLGDDEEEEDDMVGQLKKRREHLQSMLATMTKEKQYANTFGYRKLPLSRGKEREARLNRLREKVIPGQTVLVLDTNCFIGHLEAIRKLLHRGTWSIVIPLVVITELDGLKGNAPPLGKVADEALQLIESTLANSKQTRRDALRVQTSHHNFMYDISIRSEQFVFGETDKNLDDLILSTCLWWMKKQQTITTASATTSTTTMSSSGVPVCLVTADRNLSVKARARDVQVIPVSGLMEMNSTPQS